MKKHKYRWLFAIILVVILAIGIPIGINEAYKENSGYITVWNASDVLSYYGSLLGAIATTGALVMTIAFTRKQIQRHVFLERKHSKWEKVENIITQALLDISPLKMQNTEKLDGALINNIHVIISNLQSYALVSKISLDTIKCLLTPEEYRQIATYVDEISRSIMEFCKIESELEKEYTDLQIAAVSSNGVIDNSKLMLHLNKTNEIVKKIPIAYNGPYQRLLNLKREVFDKIYAEIEEEANQMIYFSKKRGKNDAHS